MTCYVLSSADMRHRRKHNQLEQYEQRAHTETKNMSSPTSTLSDSDSDVHTFSRLDFEKVCSGIKQASELDMLSNSQVVLYLEKRLDVRIKCTDAVYVTGSQTALQKILQLYEQFVCPSFASFNGSSVQKNGEDAAISISESTTPRVLHNGFKDDGEDYEPQCKLPRSGSQCLPPQSSNVEQCNRSFHSVVTNSIVGSVPSATVPPAHTSDAVTLLSGDGLPPVADDAASVSSSCASVLSTSSYRLRCKLCEYYGPDKSVLHVHIREAHNVPGSKVHSQIEFECGECDRGFSTASSLRRHYIGQHTPANQCEQCAKRFTRKCDLDNHIAKRHGELEMGQRRFDCAECTQRFLTRQGLRYHIRKTHKDWQETFARNGWSTASLASRSSAGIGSEDAASEYGSAPSLTSPGPSLGSPVLSSPFPPSSSSLQLPNTMDAPGCSKSSVIHSGGSLPFVMSDEEVAACMADIDMGAMMNESCAAESEHRPPSPQRSRFSEPIVRHRKRRKCETDCRSVCSLPPRPPGSNASSLAAYLLGT